MNATKLSRKALSEGVLKETGLCYNRHRYYDPETGRYISEDPIGLLGGLVLHGYVGDTMGWIDPFGLVSTDPGVYDVFFEAYLPRHMYRRSDRAHFREANRQLYNAICYDSSLRVTLESTQPGTARHVTPGVRGGFRHKAPPGLTWHHHPKIPGLLQLVDKLDHNRRHPDFHPGGYGGRKNWGGGKTCRS